MKILGRFGGWATLKICKKTLPTPPTRVLWDLFFLPRSAFMVLDLVFLALDAAIFSSHCVQKQELLHAVTAQIHLNFCPSFARIHRLKLRSAKILPSPDAYFFEKPTIKNLFNFTLLSLRLDLIHISRNRVQNAQLIDYQ